MYYYLLNFFVYPLNYSGPGIVTQSLWQNPHRVKLCIENFPSMFWTFQVIQKGSSSIHEIAIQTK